MVDISNQVGVPTSTLFQWASTGKWRLEDLATPQDGIIAAPDTATLPPDPIEIAETMPDPVKAAQMALARAEKLTAHGQMDQAERAVRVAERLFKIASKTGQHMSLDGTPEWDGYLPSGETEREAAERRDKEQEECLDLRKRIVDQALRSQASLVEAGDIPKMGQSFKSYKSNKSIFAAVSMGMIPYDEADRETKRESTSLINLSVATLMRENLILTGVLPQNFRQAEEIEYDLEHGAPPPDFPGFGLG